MAILNKLGGIFNYEHRAGKVGKNMSLCSVSRESGAGVREERASAELKTKIS